MKLSLVDETAIETGDGDLIMTAEEFANIDPQFRFGRTAKRHIRNDESISIVRSY